MTDNTPGIPPQETPKPNINETNRPSFSYFDLNLEDVFTSEGRKFVMFFVNSDTPHYVSFIRSEFEEYQREFFNLYDYQLENGLCSCDNCTPSEYTFIEDVKLNLLVKMESGEEVEVVETFPLYTLYNPVVNLKIGLHGEHNVNLN